MTLFGSSTPNVVNDGDTQSVEVGVKFTADVAGQVTGIRFYKGSKNSGSHMGHLWTSTGASLGAVGFTSETASGWQSANLVTPVPLTPGATYVVSYLAPRGRYSADAGYFNSPHDVSPLHAPSGSNGVYRYGTKGGFPTDTYQASNYWVDVNFVPALPATTTTTLAPTTTVPDSTTTTVVAPTTTTTAVPETTTTTTQPPPGFIMRDVTNTGPDGGALHSCAGPVTITVPGTVLDHCDFTGGGVAITADNVTITNSVIHGDVRIGRSQDNHDTATHNAVVTGNEIIGDGGGSGIAEVAGFDGIYQRNNLHGWENCATFWTATRAQVLDNWCHGMQSSSDAHFDGFEVYGVAGGITISGNTIDECCENGDVAPLNITPVPAVDGTVLVENNYLASGSSSYVVLGDDSQGTSGITAVFNGNHLQRFQNGSYWSLRHNHTSSYTGTGNVDATSGASVPVDG